MSSAWRSCPDLIHDSLTDRSTVVQLFTHRYAREQRLSGVGPTEIRQPRRRGDRRVEVWRRGLDQQHGSRGDPHIVASIPDAGSRPEQVRTAIQARVRPAEFAAASRGPSSRPIGHVAGAHGYRDHPVRSAWPDSGAPGCRSGANAPARPGGRRRGFRLCRRRRRHQRFGHGRGDRPRYPGGGLRTLR